MDRLQELSMLTYQVVNNRTQASVGATMGECDALVELWLIITNL